MKQVLLLCVLFGIVLSGSHFPAATAQEDCDPDALRDYLDARQGVIDKLNEANGQTVVVSEQYLILVGLRYELEDMEDVPECAEELHAAVIASITNIQDYVVFGATLDDFENTDSYTTLVERAQRINEFIDTEKARLEELATPASQ